MGRTRRRAAVRLHVLTAVTRPENLPALEESIRRAEERARHVDLVWHQRHDPDREHVGGQAVKNQMLDGIADGWVCVLDDDTVMHNHFLRKIEFTITRDPALEAVVVSQKRTTGVVLKASPDNAVLGKIDAGQAVLRRDLIGDERIPETYAGDGLWLEALLADAYVQYLPDVLSLHNVLSGVDVSETPERMQA